jgi:subtilase family serine protease
MKKHLFSVGWLVPSLVLPFATPLAAKDVFVGGPRTPAHVRPPLRVNASPATSVYYSPAQIRHAYGFDQLTADGTGQKIALVDAYGNPSIQSDLDTFCNQFGIPSTTVQVLGTSSVNTGWALETALDVEWAHTIAPKATIILSVANSSSISDLLNAVAAAVNAGATVVSMSWGATEFANENVFDSYFQAPGVTFVASAGDSGELAKTPEVEWPAVSPYVVSVGGTSLYLDANNNRSSEVAWSSSGGGLSTYYGAPTWQSGWSAYLKRGVPDVSYDADPNTGVLVYDSVNGGWYAVGGTSAGAPQWAAAIALANQSRTSGVTGNPDIYKVAGTAPVINSANLFDITSGNNGADADDISVTGYDLVTGLGTPVAPGLVPALVALAPQTPDFSVSVVSNSQTVATGGTATYTVTVTALGGFNGSVSFSVSGSPNDASATFSPSTVDGSGSPTLSIPAGSSTGTYAFTVTATSGSLTHTAKATLIVAKPDFSVSTNPSSKSVRHGSSTYYTVTVTPSGGFTSNVSLTATVSPSVFSGPTLSLSPQQVAGGSGSCRLTVKTSSSTPRQGYTITITGASGSSQHSNTVSLNVN